MLQSAGFRGVDVSVRQFRPEDTALTAPFRRLHDARVLDRIGRIAGWYVIAQGRKP
jgi:hypothetical protein